MSNPIERIEPGKWAATISDQFMVGKVPSGGYVTAILLDCVVKEIAILAKEPHEVNSKRKPNKNHKEILTANVHFMSSTLPGSCTCHVHVLKSGKTTSTIQASIYQNKKETIRSLATCGNLTLASKTGPNLTNLSDAVPPILPPFSDCVRVDAGDNTPNSVRSRIHCFVKSKTAVQYKGCRLTKQDGSFDEATLLEREKAVRDKGADYSGYMMFEDGHEIMLADSPIFLDAGVPPILGAYVTGWVPSINWTVQYMHHPSKRNNKSSTLLKFRFKTRRVTGGFLEEDGELWDEDGNLVAVSRQLAMVGVSQASKGKL
jgi:hypothetical protein